MEHLLLSCIESKIENNRSLYGRFQLGPFDQSQGLTVANAMRRTLLSELSGLAIICVEIQGVNHEYSNLKGVRESVLDILLNLKQIVFISDEKFTQPEIGFLKIQGPRTIKSCDLKLPTFIQCVDPDQYIATLADNGVLEMKFMICKGKNFLVQTSSELMQIMFKSHFHTKKKSQNNLSKPNKFVERPLNPDLNKKTSEENFRNTVSQNLKPRSRIQTLFPVNKIDFQKFEKNLIFDKRKTTNKSFSNLEINQNTKKKKATNLLFIDAVFMPIKKVNFSIQHIDDYSREKKLNLRTKFEKNYVKEKIILEIWTNGSIHPKHAIQQAAYKIIDTLIPFQKKYLYKQTKLISKPIIYDKLSFSSSNKILKSKFIKTLPSNNDYPILNNFRKEFNLENNINGSSNIQLNKIYRPWLAFPKLIDSKTNFFVKQKKNLEYNPLMYANKEIHSKQSIENQLKFVDIIHLNLTTKSYICLKRANINTIKDLLAYSRSELLLIKNLGEKSVKQLEFSLTKINLKLRTQI